MTKYIVEHNREECIGCGACAAIAPEFWTMNDDGKSDMKDGKKKNNVVFSEIDERDLAKHKEAAESCPVNIIHIKKQTGEKIV